MKKLGLGIQALSEFKDKNLIYVDKTEHIHRLIDDGKYYFLSRPRRFGKSLLINTLKELFEGNRRLFQGCWIEERWNWQQKNPVIKIDFTQVEYRELGLKKALDQYLLRTAEQHKITLQAETYAGKFLELIETLGEKSGTVILIDEYDKPIIDYLEAANIQQAEENREILKTFYAGVKGLDEHIRFFLLTGVSKFSRVSIFSDLNHLRDLSISESGAGLLGYTEQEIRENYQPYIEKLADCFGTTEDRIMEQVKTWYNGYSWDGRTFVYNPYSTLSLLSSRAFKNFWFETGTPTFLIKHIKESGVKINESLNKPVKESAFNAYDIDNLNTTAILFQTGYLTIKQWDRLENTYILDFPNREVKESCLDFMVKNYADSSAEEMGHIVAVLTEALRINDIRRFFEAMQALFSSITTKQLEKVKEYEGFYHSIIYITLKMLGVRIDCEVQSSFGATDAVIQNEEYIYVIEFKMGTAEEALRQIIEKRYCAPFAADGRAVIMVGIGIDKGVRNLTDFVTGPADRAGERERREQ